SVFMGDMLTRVIEEIAAGKSTEPAEQMMIKLGVAKLPEIQRDNTDRNRTSPFAFTGQKFEFRAVGSSASIAFPVALLNTAVADAIGEITETLRETLKKTKSVDDAVLKVVRDVFKDTAAIRFEGNNYSEEWVKEAEKRGLPNLRKTPEALAQVVSKSSIALLTGLKIFSEAEVHSRYHVRLERYVKNLQIEVETLRSMVDTTILPTAFRYHADLADGVAKAKAAGVESPQKDALNKITTLIQGLSAKRVELDKAYAKAESLHSEDEKAKVLAIEVSTAML